MSSHFLGHLFFYRTSKSSKYFVALGFLLMFVYIIQAFTGLLLALGINSNLYIVHTLHSSLASVFVLLAYLHLYKGLYYRWGSGSKDHYVFSSGWFLLILLLATCFTGYLLPWGQLSFWGTKVITSFLSYIPYFGDDIKIFVWGDLEMSEDITKSRFKSLHITLGLLLNVFIFIHVLFVHDKRSMSFPLCILSDSFRTAFLYAIFFIKDFYFSYVICFFLLLYSFLNPEFFEEAGNFVFANKLSTPLHIIPEWYFLPFFAVFKYCKSVYTSILISAILFFSVNISMLPAYYNNINIIYIRFLYSYILIYLYKLIYNYINNLFKNIKDKERLISLFLLSYFNTFLFFNLIIRPHSLFLIDIISHFY